MHILEDHVIPWLRHFHIGAGLMGEQGAESIHARVMKLERRYQGIRNDIEQLKYILREQELYSDPSLSALRPPVKRRKLDTSDSSDSSDEEEDEGSEGEIEAMAAEPPVAQSEGRDGGYGSTASSS